MIVVDLYLRWKGTTLFWCEKIIIPNTIESIKKYCHEEIKKFNNKVKTIPGVKQKELIKILFTKTKRRKEMPKLKALQKLAKEMQEGIGFDPPVNYEENDINVLIEDIKQNAEDLDPVQDVDVITSASKSILSELKAGPWCAEANEETDEEEEVSEEEEPKKTKKQKKVVEKKVVKSTKPVKAVKANVKPLPKKQTPPIKNAKKTNKNLGIGTWIKEQLQMKKNKNITNAQMIEKVKVQFPEAKTSPACISWYRKRI